MILSPYDILDTTDVLSVTSVDINILATWARMPAYCRYCHSLDHGLNSCPRSKRSTICLNCNQSGHIAKGCSYRNQTDGTPSHKKRKSNLPFSSRVEELVPDVVPTVSPSITSSVVTVKYGPQRNTI